MFLAHFLILLFAHEFSLTLVFDMWSYVMDLNHVGFGGFE